MPNRFLLTEIWLIFAIMENEFSSTLLENAVSEMSKLPGIGRKTALRLVLYLLRQDKDVALALGDSLIKLREGIRYCTVCHNISESEICPICADAHRDASTVCVVESVKDVMAVENTHQFHGLYHVLGGLISPMDGITPQELEMQSLVDRVATGQVREVILALSPTMEGETTNFYIFRRLSEYPVIVSMIARGVAVGNELEYTDEVTLGRSIQNRTLFSSTINNQ